MEKNAKYKKNCFWKFWDQLNNLIKTDANHVYFLYFIDFQLKIPINKFYFFRKYVPTVKTINEWMNEKNDYNLGW